MTRPDNHTPLERRNGRKNSGNGSRLPDTAEDEGDLGPNSWTGRKRVCFQKKIGDKGYAETRGGVLREKKILIVSWPWTARRLERNLFKGRIHGGGVKKRDGEALFGSLSQGEKKDSDQNPAMFAPATTRAAKKKGTRRIAFVKGGRKGVTDRATTSV